MNSALRVPGVSDKFFYYACSNHGLTMDFKIEIHFKEPVDFEKLRGAFATALDRFPEFAFRPVIKDEKFFYEENHEPVTIHDDVLERLDFGTEDTNGYLFYIIRTESDPCLAIFSFYHGLSDWAGTMRFLRTICAVYTGVRTTEGGARICAPAPEVWNTAENLDPYSVFEDKDCVPSYVPDTAGFFQLPIQLYAPGTEKGHVFRITMRVSEFLKKTRELHTSFMPYFISIAAGVIHDLYDIGDRNFVMSLPVDLRPMFKTDCVSNFSDAVLLPLSRGDLALPIEEQCKKLRASIEVQRKPENYARKLYEKAQAVRDFEKDDRGVVAVNQELTQGGFRAFASYITTYLGIMDMPAEVNEKIEHIFVNAPFGASYFQLTTFGDVLTVTSCQCYDEDTVARALCDKFVELGFTASLEDKGFVTQSTLDVSKLKRMA
ncbi:MAG: hypothetical protein J6D46_03955 [Lachnospiraceae bacterium]|nr:hypothetical protein [Lachnospiraceae bacterium]